MSTIASVGRGVISERRELYGRAYRDCTYASGMMCCRDAGIVFPLANDLDAEREALERSDTRPNETGADMGDVVLAMRVRYRYSGAPVTSMASAVRTPGYTLLMQGPWVKFPVALRHWQPKGTFNHAVAYRVDAPDHGTLLDPLAPMGYPGERATPEIMEAFCWGASYIRSMQWEATMMVPKAITSEDPATMTVAKGAGWFDLDGKTQLETGAGVLADRISPYEVGTQRAMYASIDGVRRVVLVTPVRGSVKAIPPPSPAKRNLAVTLDKKVLFGGTI